MGGDARRVPASLLNLQRRLIEECDELSSQKHDHLLPQELYRWSEFIVNLTATEALNYRPQRCQSHTSRWEEPGAGGCIGVWWCGRRRRGVIGVWWHHRAVRAPQLLGGHQRLLLLILFILLIVFLSPFMLFGFRAAAGGALCGLSSLLRRKVPVQEAHDQLKEKPQHTHEQLPGRKKRFTWRRKTWWRTKTSESGVFPCSPQVPCIYWPQRDRGESHTAWERC